MSNDNDRFKSSRRRQKDENAIKRQTRIAQSHGSPVTEPHKYVKRHAMDCGQPGCFLCGNPRKLFKELTVQEQRMLQDVDKSTKGNQDD